MSVNNTLGTGSSSPRQGPGPSGRGPEPPILAPTVDLVGPPPDYEAIEHTLAAIHLAVSRARAMESLQEAHETLQRAYQVEHRRAEDLQRQMNDIRRFAEVRAPRIQAQMTSLVRQQVVNQLVIAEYRDALAKREDNSREVETSRSQVRYWRTQYEEAVRSFQFEIDDLEARLEVDDERSALVVQVASLQAELKQLHHRSETMEHDVARLTRGLLDSQNQVKGLVRERDHLSKVLAVARGSSATRAPPVGTSPTGAGPPAPSTVPRAGSSKARSGSKSGAGPPKTRPGSKTPTKSNTPKTKSTTEGRRSSPKPPKNPGKLPRHRPRDPTRLARDPESTPKAPAKTKRPRSTTASVGPPPKRRSGPRTPGPRSSATEPTPLVIDSSSDDETVLAALAQSRASQRRSATASSVGDPVSPTVDVSQEASTGLPQPKTRPGRSDTFRAMFGSSDSESDISDTSKPSKNDSGQVSPNMARVISKDRYIPGYSQPRSFRAAEVAPWSAEMVSLKENRSGPLKTGGRTS